MIWTECMPDVDGSAIDGAIVLVEDDPSLLEACRTLQRMRPSIHALAIVPKEGFFPSVRSLSGAGKKVLGLTWSAGLAEHRLSGPDERYDIVMRADLYDGSCLFGKPAFCLLSRTSTGWKDVPWTPSVLIDRSYPKLSMDYISRWGNPPRMIVPPSDGCMGDCGIAGRPDLVLAMVGSCEILDRWKLHPLEELLPSDPVLIKAAASEERSTSIRSQNAR